MIRDDHCKAVIEKYITLSLGKKFQISNNQTPEVTTLSH